MANTYRLQLIDDNGKAKASVSFIHFADGSIGIDDHCGTPFLEVSVEAARNRWRTMRERGWKIGPTN